MLAAATTEAEKADLLKMMESPLYLTDHLHEIPVLVVPCIEGRVDGMSAVEQASHWGGILPATWSFMLAARSRGLGTVYTTLHLDFEQEAAEVLEEVCDERAHLIARAACLRDLGDDLREEVLLRA